MNNKHDLKAATKKFDEVDREHPVFGMGAEVAA